MASMKIGDRRPYLAAIPSSERVQERLRRVLTEARQLRVLLRTAREIERAESLSGGLSNGTEVARG